MRPEPVWSRQVASLSMTNLLAHGFRYMFKDLMPPVSLRWLLPKAGLQRSRHHGG